MKPLTQSCLVTYDPNIRPLLGSHTEAMTIFEDLLPLTDVVKLSDEDAHWLYPGWSPDDEHPVKRRALRRDNLHHGSSYYDG